MKSSVLVLCLLLQAVASPVMGADEPDFAAGVRSTEPLAAAEQLGRFKLPEGFKISLFSEEPEIAKPMNMAFDSQGRLWVTSSLEYPYAAPADRKAKDTLRVLEDTNGDGRADKVTTFADGLNIPIGVYPFNGGASALVWSIPNIWRMDDTDGDGVADKREILIGPIGDPVDTHGMQNSFTRAFDGWVYVCHGFRNDSKVKSKDGTEIRLQSGNTYRFKLDGSRVEQYTWGQVNPFGMCLDPLGNHYTADCHSSPIYQLIRGGYYPSFGKPDDGLGFAPLLMQHAHGSTALCGVTYYSADSNWPEEFRDTLFVGNVMTSRVHRDQVVFNGASPKAIEMPEFLTSSDPWFRPVDIQMGPDGALYVADFYNRIIGHYEVPLTHPGRDRYRGRIWRVTYEGGRPFRAFTSLAQAPIQELVDRLADKNLPARLMAMHELVDRYGLDAAAPVHQALKNSRSPEQKVAALWILERLGKLDSGDLATSISGGATREECVHALRIAGEIPALPGDVDIAAVNALGNADPFVVRQAGEMLGRHPNARNIPLLLGSLRAEIKEDDHTRYVMLRALRSQFLEPGAFAAYRSSSVEPNSAIVSNWIASIASSIQSADAADFLLAHLSDTRDWAPADADRFLQHAARYVSVSNLGSLVAQVRQRFANDIGQQAKLFQSVESGMDQRGVAASGVLKEWANDLAAALLRTDEGSDWHVASAGEGGIPWVIQQRGTKDDGRSVNVLSSLPEGGEALTSVLQSRSFSIPEKMSIQLCGHDGYPGGAAKGVNYIVLSEVPNGAEIARVPAPRSDEVVSRTLDLAAYAGRSGRLEIVDGDTGDAYAWIGFAGTEPSVVALPAASLRDDDARLQQGIALAQRWRIAPLMPAVARLARDLARGSQLRSAALDALSGELAVAVASEVLGEQGGAPILVASALRGFAMHAPSDGQQDGIPTIGSALAALPSRLQRSVASVIAEHQGEWLLSMVESKAVSPAVLVDAGVRSGLEKSAPAGWQKRLAELTANVPSDLERLQKLTAERLQVFNSGGRDAASGGRGEEIFASQCVICHQLGGKGSLVGPQLDGVGKRGAERLLEDIINPNQNVDHAFQLTYVTLKNGETKAGLFRREEGETLVFADAAGAEFSVVSADVTKREDTGMSLMPPVFGDALTAEQIFDLTSFLMSQP